MPRRDTRETDSDEISADDGPPTNDWRVELRRIERRVDNRLRVVETDSDARLRGLEAWRTVVDGLPGYPGKLPAIDAKLAEVESDLEAAEQAVRAGLAKIEADTSARFAAVDAKQSRTDAALEKIGGLHWKVVVAACTAGAIVAFVFAIAGNLMKAISR